MKRLSVVCIVGLIVLAGCGRKEKKEQLAEAERLAQMGEKAEILVDSSKLYSEDKLLGLLPKSLPNMKRLSREAKKSGAIGKKTSRAEVSFEGENGEFVDISITDAVGIKGMGAIPDGEWTTKDVKEDTDSRFVSVEKKNGRRLYKEFNASPKKAVARLLVGDRFVVEVVGSEMEYPSVEALLDQVQIGMLEKMAVKK